VPPFVPALLAPQAINTPMRAAAADRKARAPADNNCGLPRKAPSMNGRTRLWRVHKKRWAMTNWLITGIGGGLGRELARAALARGDNVFGTSRSVQSCAAFEALAPGRAFAEVLVFSDAAAPRRVVTRAEAAMGSIDRLVNNAGFGLVGAIEEVSLEEIRALFDVNVFGAIAMIQAVLPGMRARGTGQIANITSVSGLAPWAGTAIYGASKYALECIGQTLAQEAGPMGIKVTNVAPGGMRTDFAGGSLRIAAHEIPAYAETAHFARHSLTANAGGERGDPARAAAAILAALDAPAPPVHLLLGEDALHYAEGQMDLLKAEIERWKDLSTSIAFPEALDA